MSICLEFAYQGTIVPFGEIEISTHYLRFCSLLTTIISD